MTSADAIRDILKRVLRTQGIRYRELGRALRVSESTVKRFFARGGDMRLALLERICRYVNLDLFEVTRLAARETTQAVTSLTLRQERAFVSDPKLFWFFLFVVKQASVEGVRRRFKLTQLQVDRYLLELDTLGLIDLRRGQNFKALASPTVRWAKKGPLAQWFYEMGRKVFLGSTFEGKDEFFKFYIVKFTEESFVRFRTQLEHLAEEMLAKSLEFDVLSADTKRTGVLMAFKPIDISAFELHGRASP